MAYNRINPVAKYISIASLAYALSGCGGRPAEMEKNADSPILFKRDGGLSKKDWGFSSVVCEEIIGSVDATVAPFPWHVRMCEYLGLALVQIFTVVGMNGTNAAILEKNLITFLRVHHTMIYV